MTDIDECCWQDIWKGERQINRTIFSPLGVILWMCGTAVKALVSLLLPSSSSSMSAAVTSPLSEIPKDQYLPLPKMNTKCPRAISLLPTRLVLSLVPGIPDMISSHLNVCVGSSRPWRHTQFFNSWSQIVDPSSQLLMCPQWWASRAKFKP